MSGEVVIQNGAEACQKCGENHASPPHTCPYMTEVHGDETECTCCASCTSECDQEV